MAKYSITLVVDVEANSPNSALKMVFGKNTSEKQFVYGKVVNKRQN